MKTQSLPRDHQNTGENIPRNTSALLVIPGVYSEVHTESGREKPQRKLWVSATVDTCRPWRMPESSDFGERT